jgi:ParB-like chromosome segregation protein Spo0J
VIGSAESWAPRRNGKIIEATGTGPIDPRLLRSTENMQPMVIQPVAVTRLRPCSRNARTHSKKQIRQIADSIRKFGFTNPVLVGDDDEIIAGHGRVEAAKLIGLQTVPAVRLSHLDAEQRRAYVLADNSSP